MELLNRGDNEVDLSGWFIDDDGTTISSNAYRLPSGSVIQPYGLLLVNLPEDSSFITNTEEILRLLDSDGQEIVRVVTPELPQGLSFARESIDSDEWDFSAIPTPGEHNEFASRPARVIISEIYYRPVGDDEDFIELYNRESIWVDLQGWKIKAGNTEYIFPKGASIAPQSYLLLMGEIINVRINDSNIEYLRLLRPDGAEQDNWGNKGNIPSPQAGQSLMVSDSSVMVTNSPTPGWANKRTNLASMSGTLASRINIVSPVAANTSAEAGVVAGDSVQVESDSASNSSSAQDLPIIIESNQNKGFFHRIKRFFCVVSFGLLKC